MTKKDQLNKKLADKYMYFNFLLHYYMKKKQKRAPRFGRKFEGQGQILTILKEQPSITQRELARRVKMRPQSTSEMIGKLEKKGFIKRKKSEQDKRVMLIELTESGKEAIENDRENEFESIVLDILTPEEKAAFRNILDKLASEMEILLKDDLSDLPKERKRAHE